MDNWFLLNAALSLVLIAVCAAYNLARPNKLSVHYRLGAFGLSIIPSVAASLFAFSPGNPHSAWLFPLMVLLCWTSVVFYFSFLLDLTSSPRVRFFKYAPSFPVVITLLTLLAPGHIGKIGVSLVFGTLSAVGTFWMLLKWVRSASDFRARRDAEWILMVFSAFSLGLVISFFRSFAGLLWVLSLWYLVLHIIVNMLHLLEEITGQDNLVIMDNVFDIVLILDSTGHVTRMNRRGYQLSGFSSLRVRGSGIEELIIHPELSASRRMQWLIRYCWRDSETGSVRSPSIDAWLTTESGEEIPVDLRVVSLVDLRKRRTGYVISATDMRITRQLMKEISDREYAARGLALSESKFSRMFIFNPSGILIVDLDSSSITDANPAIEEILETPTHSLVGRNLQGIGLEMDGMNIPSLVEKVLMEGSVPEFSARIAIPGKIVRKCRLSAVSFDLNQSRRMLLSVTDVTQQEQMREALTRKQKVETIGVLAGGIAHDFNNILAVILGHIGLAKMRVSEVNARSPIEKAEYACLRAREMTRQLLAFSRGGTPVISVCPLRSLIVDSSMLAVSDTAVACLFDIPQDVWAVRVDRIQFGQVIANLVGNAVEAMDRKGIIEISAENLDLRETSPHRCPLGTDSLPLPRDTYVKIQVKDQGPGIPDEIKPHIFDPFFTTKEKGTGMGLSIVFSVIQNHKGSVWAESAPDGTVFNIIVPADPDFVDGDSSHNPHAVLDGTRVLLMDDDAMVLETAAGMLGSLGYEVTQSRSGEQAFALYRQAVKAEKPFAFCVLDQVVPHGMSGSDCAREIRALDPDALLFISSGYSDDPVLARFKDYGFCGVIQKPYTLEELRTALSNVLVT
ncbi:MAG TPA: ATP-binding protein [Treponemataceae bacterium]|nr:ATP-binding protein [Treponemataceae bacterium]